MARTRVSNTQLGIIIPPSVQNTRHIPTAGLPTHSKLQESIRARDLPQMLSQERLLQMDLQHVNLTCSYRRR